MQNLGSDAGVFVWADDADGRHYAVSADACCNAMLKNSQRHAEENTSRSLRDIPVIHTAPANIRWCVLTISKNNFRESRKPNRQSDFSWRKVTSGLDQGSSKI
jgi:hypothetical protein